jgi:HSP20 family molecular chaperone IbpA
MRIFKKESMKISILTLCIFNTLGFTSFTRAAGQITINGVTYDAGTFLVSLCKKAYSLELKNVGSNVTIKLNSAGIDKNKISWLEDKQGNINIYLEQKEKIILIHIDDSSVKLSGSCSLDKIQEFYLTQSLPAYVRPNTIEFDIRNNDLIITLKKRGFLW